MKETLGGWFYQYALCRSPESDDDAPDTLAKLNSICAKSEQKAKEEI